MMAARLIAAAAALAVLAVLCWAAGTTTALGMNWGTQATHPLPPKAVVQVLQDNGIKKVKLFDTDQAAMSALAGTGIEVMVAIPNNMLADLADDAGKAKDWVKRNVRRYDFDGGVTIKYVAVGNEPFLESYNGSFINVTFPALENIQNALNDAGVGDRIKATVPLNADVYNSPKNNQVPSAGRFRSDIAGLMTDIVKFLAKNGAPFTVNIYPFLSLYLNDNFPLDYAFFDGGATPVNDNGVLYTNVFDANFDTLVAALGAVGHGNLPIVVGEVGWPTDGDKHAKASYAQRFYAGLLKRLAANTGTPARPNQYTEVYLFGLVDEDAKSVAPGNFERHWGVLRYDGQPKFAMDLTGQGRNTMLVPAKGVKYLPRTWCALNPNAKDLGKLGANIDYACTFADCTPLGVRLHVQRHGRRRQRVVRVQRLLPGAEPEGRALRLPGPRAAHGDRPLHGHVQLHHTDPDRGGAGDGHGVARRGRAGAGVAAAPGTVVAVDGCVRLLAGKRSAVYG